MKKTHYAWAVLSACCALSLGIGLTSNCMGQYFVPVTRDLNLGMGPFTMYLTIRGVFLVVSLSVLHRVLEKVNTRLLLSGCFAIILTVTALMATFSKVWQWYIAGAILGIFGPPVHLVIPPIILSNWFIKKRGFAIGIAMTFSGIGGAIMNPVLAWIIQSYGWRVAYVANAVIAGVIVLPFLMFVIRLKPADKGLQPFGYEEVDDPDRSGTSAVILENEAQVKGVSREVAIRSFSFVIMTALFAVMGFFAGYTHLLTAYGVSIGLTATMAAALPSLSMVGNIVGKLALGLINDRYGGKRMTYCALGISTASLIFLLYGADLMASLAVGAFLAGNFLTVTSVAAPLLVHSVYGPRDYTRIFVLLSLAQNVMISASQSIIGFIYDFTGSYATSFVAGIVSVIVCLCLVHFSFLTSKKLIWTS